MSDLRAALAYALVRAQLPGEMETAGDYAGRLAPLVVESGYLAAPPPEAGLREALAEVEAALTEAFGGTDDIVWDNWRFVRASLDATPAPPDGLREALVDPTLIAALNDAIYDAAVMRTQSVHISAPVARAIHAALARLTPEDPT